MAAPIYFLPHVAQHHVTPELLFARGLAEVADIRDAGQMPMYALSGSGPGGLPGTVVCFLAAGRMAPDRFGYCPERNDWEADGDPELLWLGIDRQDPPGPADLLRASRRLPLDPRDPAAPAHPGYEVTLAGDTTWTVPVIRRPNGGTTLPSHWGWDAEGKFTTTLDRRYQAIWDALEPVVAMHFDPEAPNSMPAALAAELCVAVLALNYRITRPLQSRCRFFGSDNWNDILGAAVDYPFFRDAIRRKLAQDQRPPFAPAPNQTPATPVAGLPISPGSTA